jgi:hypothetical protein
VVRTASMSSGAPRVKAASRRARSAIRALELDTDDTIRPPRDIASIRDRPTLDRSGTLIMTIEALAFALLVGAQFLAAIFLISRRTGLYPDARPPTAGHSKGPSGQIPGPVRPVGWVAPAE